MPITMKLPKIADFKVNTIKSNQETATIKVDLIDKDFNLVFKNLQTVNTLTKFAVARAIASIAIDLLAESQPRVPYYDGGGEVSKTGGLGKPSTGKLRLSGRSVIQYGRSYKDIAWGAMGGEIVYDIAAVNRASVKNATKIGAVVFYSRDWASDADTSNWGISSSGPSNSLAEWLHENLQPHDARSMKQRGDGMYYARGKGTGPKYLEGPWLYKKEAYINHLYKVVNKIEKVIPLITKLQTSKGRHTVDRSEIIENRIEEYGYYFDFKG